MKKKLVSLYALVFIIGIVFTPACQDDVLDINENQEAVSHELKKGGKQTDVDQADLYGDLREMEIDNRGVPILYELNYRADYQDNWVEGIMDVVNPKLDGPFTFNALERDADGYVVYESEDNPLIKEVTVELNADGFVVGEEKVIELYDAEGEVLPAVALHVVPIEMGRLNIIRSPSTVIERRLSEVIKNFGDGTVANVTRDFCGRLMMLRTDAAIALGVEDKTIDSPLENLSVYKELMLHGFTGAVADNGLKFLIEEDTDLGGFDFQFRVDEMWEDGAKSYSEVDSPNQLIMNLAAACISAGSDKTNTLIIDEIVFVNLFMGVPEVIGNGIDQPATTVNCFLPTVEQEIRMMDKTDKHQYSRYRYYVDFSTFEYDRRKFQETLLDYVTIVGDYDNGVLIGSHNEILAENLKLHDILMGNAPLTAAAEEIYKYTSKEGQSTSGAFGFACQADDYVQALEVIHENEEFLVWHLSTPTWTVPQDFDRTSALFNYVPEEEDHSKRPDGHGDDSVSDGTGGGSSSGGGRRGGRDAISDGTDGGSSSGGGRRGSRR